MSRAAPPPPDPAAAPAGRAAPAGTLGERAVGWAVGGIIGAALAMPHERRVPFAGAAMRRALGPMAGYGRRARENLRLIHPDWPEARRRAVAGGVLDNLGRTVIEIQAWPDLRARLRAEDLGGPGVAAFEAARAAGRPVILLSGHFGNFTVPAHILTLRGHRVAALYRPLSNAFVNGPYVGSLEGMSGPVFPKTRAGVLGFVRHLAGGGVAKLMFDQHERQGAALPFLGRPALTATTAADLALRLDALLLPMWGIRRPDGLGFDAVLEEPIAPGPPLGMMREANGRLEARIARWPEQWFWVHRRWKGAPAPAGAAAP